MALVLPSLDDVLGPVSAPSLVPKVAPPKRRPFDLLPPEEQARINLALDMEDRQAQLAAQPRSALGEIGAGFARGAMVGLPRMVGQALKSTGQEGGTLYGLGKGAVATADQNEVKYAQDLNPGAHGEVVNAVSGYVEHVAPSVAPMVAGLALAPFTGGASAMAGAGVAGAGLFGASQYQDTYEKALKAGKTREEAHALGLQTGAIEAVGEGIGSAVGAKFLTGSGKLLSSALGIKRTVPDALAEIAKPKFLPKLAKDWAATAAVEVGTEMGQGAGQAGVEQAAGIDKTTPWDAATGAIGPSLTLSVLLAPFGGLALKRQQSRNRDMLQIAQDPNASPEAVAAAGSEIAAQIAPMVGKADANQWRLDMLANSVKSQEERDALAAKAKTDAAQAEQEQQGLEIVQAQERRAQAAEAIALQQNPPEGAMSFSAFVSEQRKQSEMFSEKKAKLLPEAVLRGRYIEYLRELQARATTRDETRATPVELEREGQARLFPDAGEGVPGAQERPPFALEPGAAPTEAGDAYAEAVAQNEALPFTPRNDAQGELDLMPVMNRPAGERPSPLNTQERPLPPVPEPTPPTPFQEALAPLQQRMRRQEEFLAASEGQSTPITPPTLETDVRGQAEVLARRAANAKLADAAMSGKITGNTPVAAADLMDFWQRVHGEELQTRFPVGQKRVEIERAIRKSAAEKLWMRQLKVLRDARDNITGAAAKESLTALINRLENFNGSKSVPEGQGTGQGTAEAQSVPEGQEGLLKGEPKEVSPFVDPLAAAPTVNAEGAAKADSTPPPVPAEVVPPAPPPAPPAAATVVTATGEEKPASKRTKAKAAPPKTQAEAVKMKLEDFSDESPNPERDAAEARDPVLYDFELIPYDPRDPQGDGNNLLWTLSYRDARNDLAMVDDKGRPLPQTPEVLARAARAKQALWDLADSEKSGPRTSELAKERVARIERIDALSDRVQGFLQNLVSKSKRQAARETKKAYMTSFLGRTPTDKELRAFKVPKEAVAAMHRRAVERAAELIDEASGVLQKGLPAHAFDNELAKALDTNSTQAALTYLAESGPTEWTRYLAKLLLDVAPATRLTMVQRRIEDEKGGRVYGRYVHATGVIRIFLGGENAHTVLHESTHSATVGRLDEAFAALRRPASTWSVTERARVAALRDLQHFMREMKKHDTTNQYAFTNEAEFVAEVLSNENFQIWLREQQYDARNGWQKFLDWVAGILGASPYAARNALDAALSVSLPMLSDSRFDAGRGQTYEHSATAAAARTDAVIPNVLAEWERLALKHNLVGNAAHRARGVAYELSSAWNLRQIAARIPSLRGFTTGLHAKTAADELKQEMKSVSQQESGTVTSPLLSYYAGLGKAKAEAMDARLARLAEFSSIHNVELWSSFADNQARNKKLDPKLREEFARMQADYKSLPVEVREPFDQAFRVLRKGYLQYSANLIRSLLQSYAGEYGPLVNGAIDLLDIRAPALSEGKNPEPGKYLDAYSYNLDRLIRKTLEDLTAATKGESSHLRADIRDAAKFYMAARDNPYAHLGRAGEFFVRLKVAKGEQSWARVAAALEASGKVAGLPNEERSVFVRFENVADRTEFLRMLDAIPSAVEGGTLQSGSLTDDTASGAAAAALMPFVQRAKRHISETFKGKQAGEMRQFLDRMLLDVTPDSSPSKMLAQRKNGGVSGSDATFMRNFAKRAGAMSSTISTAYTLPKYDAAFRNMEDEVAKLESGKDAKAADQARQLFNEVNVRFHNTLNPVQSPHIDAFRAFGFNMYLAFSPAFWLTNLMQPWHLGLPWLGSRYGFVNSAKELGKSSGKAFSLVRKAIANGWDAGSDAGGLRGALLGVLDLTLQLNDSGLRPDEIAFVKQLISSGQLDTTQGHELGHLGEGEQQWKLATMKALSAGSHYTEVFNRLAQGLAGYNLSLRHPQEGKKLGAQFAITRGIEGVRETQLDYSDHNVSRALGRHGRLGKVTPLMASFQTYSMQVTELLVRMTLDAVKAAHPEDRARARKEIAGVLGTTGVLAGTLGLPFVTVISAVIDRIFGSDDDPSDVKVAFRQWLASVFGKDVAEIIAHGLPRAIGIDTSTRMGLASVLPGSQFMADRRALKDQLEAGAFNMLGPAVSAGTSMITGISKVLDGFVMDGLVEMSPIAVKGPLKAEKMAEHGYTTATGNALPMEVTPWAVAAQAVGFSPSVKAEYSEANFAELQRRGQLERYKDKLTNKLMVGIERGQDVAAELQEAMLFSAKHPEMRIDVSAGLQARAKARAVAASNPAGIATLPRYLPTLDRYSYANVK